MSLGDRMWDEAMRQANFIMLKRELMKRQGVLIGITMFVKVAPIAELIFNSNLGWKEKADLIFAHPISGLLREAGLDFHPPQPTGDAEADLRGFMAQLLPEARTMNRLLEDLRA